MYIRLKKNGVPADNAADLRMGWKAWIAEHGSGKEGAGAAAVIPAAGITSVIRD
jgi:hypothetical protein